MLAFAMIASTALLGFELMRTGAKTTEARAIAADYDVPADSVAVFSNWRHAEFIGTDTHGQPRSMWQPMLALIPAYHNGSLQAASYPALDAMPDRERQFVKEIAASFVRQQPGLVLLDVDPPAPSMRGFNYVEYFAADPQFAAAMKGYDQVSVSKHFRVYRRRDLAVARNELTQTER